MSRKYPRQSKREAIGIRQIHDDISFTRYATAVRERALGRWREQLRKKQNSSYVRKNFSIGHKTDTKSACRCKQRRNVPTRRRPPNGWGYPPPPRIHTVSIHYAKTRVFYGHVMGILRAFARTFAPRPTISVGGQLATASDVDFYQFDVDRAGELQDARRSTIFDIDYAAGFDRPDRPDR